MVFVGKSGTGKSGLLNALLHAGVAPGAAVHYAAHVLRQAELREPPRVQLLDPAPYDAHAVRPPPLLLADVVPGADVEFYNTGDNTFWRGARARACAGASPRAAPGA